MKKVREIRQGLKNKKGFTLIELIVVIAVIGILVLLAAPKFLGHTKDAQVATMQADAKTLSNAALTYYVDLDANGDGGEWPAESTPTEYTVAGVETYPLDKGEVGEYYKNIKGELTDYVIVIEPGNEHEGEVFHAEGVPGKDGETYHGVDSDLKVTK